MSNIPHLPALRLGRSYESLEKIEVRDHRSGEIKAVVSQVNGGILKRDLPRLRLRVELRRLMKIATFNINGIKARLPRLLEWLEETRPAVACLQEIKTQDEGFPAEEFEKIGRAHV